MATREIKQEDHTFSIAVNDFRNSVLDNAASIARTNAPCNEPGEYWRGRRDAANDILAIRIGVLPWVRQ